MFSMRRFRCAVSVVLRFSLLFSLSLFSQSVFAFGTYLDTYNTNYGTAGTRLDSCGLCHYNFNGGGARTSYGEDFRNNNYNPVTIGSFDSDGDGFTNDEESAAGTLTFPAFSCTDLVNVLNAPADLADYVDPSNLGCIGSGEPPVPNINGPYVVVNNQPHTYSSAGSFDPDGTIVSYLWNFTGYGTSTEANPVFTLNPGFGANVTISLTVTDNDGNFTTVSTVVRVLMTPNDPPIADAGLAVTGVVNNPVQFDGTASSDPENTRLTYVWDFGDGNSGTGALPSHSYGRCGNYTVTLTVTDGVGLSGNATTSATIASSGVDAPVANAGGDATGHYSGDVDTNIQFDGSASQDPDCDIVTYSWDFGDNSSGLGVTPVHSYSIPGDYVVTLTVTDNDGLSASSTATVTVIDSGPLDGAALYDANCGACHGFGAASTKAGADLARLEAGIANVPSMNYLATSLSAAETQAIADYLVSLSPPTGGDGATLYANNCASCHGDGANSTKVGADATRINNGIANVASMNYLSGVLSAADVQLIGDYLVSLSPPTGGDGATLYANNCASCHGDGANSTKVGADATRINNGITNVPTMNYLSGVLSAADVDTIADYLVSLGPSLPPTELPVVRHTDSEDGFLHATGKKYPYSNGCTTCHGFDLLGSIGPSCYTCHGEEWKENAPPPPPENDGLALYDVYCADCHGAGNSSNKPGASATRITDGIINVESMKALVRVLSSTQIQSIADYLGTITSTPPPSGGGGTGETLYATNCAGCHGAGDSSTKAGADVTRINNGISSVASMNYLSGVLSQADVQAIADYLTTSAPPTTPEGRYVTYCASCHGVDAKGGSSGEDVRDASGRDIRKAIDDERDMRYLDFLSYEETQSIAEYLDGL